MDYKKIDIKAIEVWVKKIASPSTSQDLNAFLEKLPYNAGQVMLVIAGIAWAAAGAVGLYATVQTQELTKLRAELQEAKSVRPVVPTLRNVPVGSGEITAFVEKIKDVYSGIEVKAQGSSIQISAKSTADFGQFREAIGHVQNGGSGWRVSVDRLCVGRECERQPLLAVLKINKVDIQKPNA